VNGNHADSVMAQAGLTARRTCRAGAKAEHSEPTIRFRCGGRSTDKSYPGDNRLVSPESSYRRRCSAPRCRLILSWGWRRSQGFGCSPIKKIRELGSDRGVANRKELIDNRRMHLCSFLLAIIYYLFAAAPSESSSENDTIEFFVLIKNKMSLIVRLIVFTTIEIDPIIAAVPYSDIR